MYSDLRLTLRRLRCKVQYSAVWYVTYPTVRTSYPVEETEEWKSGTVVSHVHDLPYVTIVEPDT